MEISRIYKYGENKPKNSDKMPYKQKSVPLTQAPGIYNPERIKIDDLFGKGGKNYAVQLEGGGTLKTKSGLLSKEYSITKQLNDLQREMLLRELLSYGTYNKELDVRGNNQSLYLSAEIPIAGNPVLATVEVMSIGSWNSNASIHLTPNLPKMFRKGEEGSNAGGNDVRLFEGVDKETNQKALDLARGLNRTFGLMYGKLDEKCATKVCVGKKEVKQEGIRALLSNSAVSLVLEVWENDYRKTTDSYMTLVYSGGTLSITGKQSENSWAPASVVDKILHSVEVVPDSQKPVQLDEYYRYESGIGQRIWNALGSGLGKLSRAPYNAVSEPIRDYRADQRKKEREVKAKLFEEVIVKRDPAVQGGFCIVTYDPACFLDQGKQKQEEAIPVAAVEKRA